MMDLRRGGFPDNLRVVVLGAYIAGRNGLNAMTSNCGFGLVKNRPVVFWKTYGRNKILATCLVEKENDLQGFKI